MHSWPNRNVNCIFIVVGPCVEQGHTTCVGSFTVLRKRGFSNFSIKSRGCFQAKSFFKKKLNSDLIYPLNKTSSERVSSLNDQGWLLSPWKSLPAFRLDSSDGTSLLDWQTWLHVLPDDELCLMTSFWLKLFYIPFLNYLHVICLIVIWIY